MRAARTSIVVFFLLAGTLTLAAGDEVERAQALIASGAYRDALKVLDPVLDSHGKSVPAQMTAVSACLGLRSVNCAKEHLHLVEKVAPNTPGLFLLRGRILQLESEFAAAERGDATSLAYYAADMFAKAAAEDPGNPRILELRAKTLLSSKRYAVGRGAFDAWIAADPRNPEAYGGAAATLALDGGWDELPSLLDKAPKDDPALLNAIRVSVLRRTVRLVPWPSIEPLFDTVEAEATDPIDKKGLHAFRAISSGAGDQALLAALEYLDADASDQFGIVGMLAIDPGYEKLYGDTAKKDGYREPVLVQKTEPIYPDAARNARIQGRVILVIRIETSGAVGSAHAVEWTHPMFVGPAEAAVRKWKYKPATIHGEPVVSPYLIRVDFRIR